MLGHCFLWGRDRLIYGPSRKELERVVRSQRLDYLDTWLSGASDRLSADAVALLEASLADPDSSTGFNRMKGDAGQETLDNILEIGRAHVRTPVTNAQLVCRILLDTKNNQ